MKITLIGAGSGCFSIGLVRDLCASKYLTDINLYLMDINTDRLEAIYELCTRYCSEIGASLKVEKTTDRVKAIAGADFVITTALAAPYNQLMDGWKIADKHSFDFYGSHHIKHDEAFWSNYYQFKLFESITEDILTYAPNAWHLLISNPVISAITHIKRKYKDAKIVGICHGGYGAAYRLADYFEISREDFTFQMTGVNHFVWLTKGYLKHKCLFEAIDEELEKGKSPLGKLEEYFYRHHGVIGLGDTTYFTGGAWPWYWWANEQNRIDYGYKNLMDGWNEAYFNWTAKLIEDLAKISKDKSRSVKTFLESVWVDDLTMPLIESLACNIPRLLHVNVLNSNGIVQGIPKDFSVEVLSLCQKDEIRPIQVDPLPRSILAYIMRDRIAPVEMELEAYNRGKIELLKELVLMDKWAVSTEQVDAFMDEIMNLPYHKELKAHYEG